MHEQSQYSHDGLTTGELASRLDGSLAGSGEVVVRGIQTVDDASGEQITFITDRKHALRWPNSAAAATIVSTDLELPSDPAARPVIRVADAVLASFAVLELFAPALERPAAGVHPSAVVDASAAIGQRVAIGAHVSIGPRCSIGDDCTLHPGVRLYEDVQVGERTELHANVVVRHRVSIGRRVIIHQNCSIGADGFGYRPSPDGTSLIKAPHIGTVVIGDDVEIGANSCVDRAKLGETRIGTGTKIDNLVQIGHNCQIGRCCVIASQTGLGGSVIVEDGVMIGGQVGVAEHRRLGKRGSVAAQSGILKDVRPGEMVMGSPAEPIREFLRMHAVLHTLSDSRNRPKRTLKEDPQQS